MSIGGKPDRLNSVTMAHFVDPFSRSDRSVSNANVA